MGWQATAVCGVGPSPSVSLSASMVVLLSASPTARTMDCRFERILHGSAVFPPIVTTGSAVVARRAGAMGRILFAFSISPDQKLLKKDVESYRKVEAAKVGWLFSPMSQLACFGRIVALFRSPSCRSGILPGAPAFHLLLPARSPTKPTGSRQAFRRQHSRALFFQGRPAGEGAPYRSLPPSPPAVPHPARLLQPSPPSACVMVSLVWGRGQAMALPAGGVGKSLALPVWGRG